MSASVVIESDRAFQNRRRLRNSGLIAAFSILNMAVGLAVQGWLAARLGVGSLADVFQTGITVPTFAATAFLAAVPICLVPLLVSHGESPPSGVPRRDLLALLALPLSLAALEVGFAGSLSRLIAPGMTDAEQVELALFLRLTAPVLVLAMFCAIAQAHLVAQRRFAVASAAPAINGLLLISGFLLAQRQSAITIGPLALAVVAGYVAQVVWTSRGWRDVASPHLKAPPHLILIPTVAMIGAYLLLRVQPVIERALSSSLGVGTAASLGYASKLQQGFTLLAVFGVGAVTLPDAAAELKGGDSKGASDTLDHSLELTIIATLVACTAAFGLAKFLVAILFFRGQFSASDIAPVSTLVRASLPTVFLTSLTGPIIAIVYAARNQRAAISAGFVGLVLGAVCSILLRPVLGAPGILLGTGIGALAALLVQTRNAHTALNGWHPKTLVRRNQRHLLLMALPLVFVSVAATITGERLITDEHVPSPPVLLAITAAFGTLTLASAYVGARGILRSSHTLPTKEPERPPLPQVQGTKQTLETDDAATPV